MNIEEKDLAEVMKMLEGEPSPDLSRKFQPFVKRLQFWFLYNGQCCIDDDLLLLSQAATILQKYLSSDRKAALEEKTRRDKALEEAYSGTLSRRNLRRLWAI